MTTSTEKHSIPRVWTNVLAGVIVIVWLLAVGGGLRALYSYEMKPGLAAHAGTRWPKASHVTFVSERPTLVMFAHPECPCSRASLGNLETIMAQSQGKVSAYVVFNVPHGYEQKWMHADLCRSAARIPGVKVIYDIGGGEMKQFGAKTSGQTLLYDSDGQLQFDGGITAARGHYGDNDGSDIVVSLIRSEKPKWHSTPVYGCSLSN